MYVIFFFCIYIVWMWKEYMVNQFHTWFFSPNTKNLLCLAALLELICSFLFRIRSTITVLFQLGITKLCFSCFFHVLFSFSCILLLCFIFFFIVSFFFFMDGHIVNILKLLTSLCIFVFVVISTLLFFWNFLYVYCIVIYNVQIECIKYL